MIIAVDIGNTNIHVGILNRHDLIHEIRLRTDRLKTWEEYLLLLQSFMQYKVIAAEDIEGSIISSVVPSLRTCFKQVLEELTEKPCLVVGPGLKTGINIVMDNPATVGSDLIVDAVGAVDLYSLPLVIFDLGTATTMSVIDAKGNYIGGVIAPGLRVSVDALANQTSSLPHIDFSTPDRLIGKNTIQCMKSGAIYGHAALLDGLLERVTDELGQVPTAVATGGLIDAVLPFCRRSILAHNTLTLHGLVVLYEKNQQLEGKSLLGRNRKHE